MITYFGDFSEDETLYIPFNTFTSDDPAASSTITNLANGDIKVHKDGSTDEIVTDGATVAINFDGVTGNHLITIDTSVHSDYSTGSDYMVRIEGTTIDGGTVNAWVGSFSIENRHSAGALRPTTAGRTLDITAGGTAGIDWGNVENKTTANDFSGTDIQLCDTVTTLTGHTVQTGDSYARLGANGAGLSAVPWNASWDAEVQSECNDAMVVLHLDHLFGAAYDPAAKPGAADAYLNEIAENDGGVTRFTENALEQAPSGTGASAATIADAVWDEAQADHTSGTSFGALATEIATIDSEVGGIQTDLDNGTDGLGALKTLIDTVNTDLANGTDGLGALKTLIDTVNTDLANGTDGLGALKTLIDAANTAIGNLQDLSAADVNAQVVDALNVDTYAEPGSIPAATASLVAKIGLLAAIARNKLTQTATTHTLRNDGDSGNIGTATVSDDATTFTRGEYS